MRIISIMNQKGGCGKTTTAVNLAACLAKLEKRVLLVDMDPQSHASIGLGVDVEDRKRSLYDLLLAPEGCAFREVVLCLGENFCLIPSHTVLSTLEQKLAGAEGRESRLRKALAHWGGAFDYVIIDTPPNIGLLTFNALRACTQVVVPVEPSFFSLHGLAKLMHAIELVKDKYHQEILSKALLTMYDPQTRFCREVLKNIKNYFNANTYEVFIHRTVKLKEAAACGKSIIDYAANSRAGRDYMSLAGEVSREEENFYLGSYVTVENFGYTSSRQITFMLESPRAREVLLVGDFNSWRRERALPLYRENNGTWKKNFFLEPGKYQYKFIVDGEWVNDPKNEKVVPNEFGGTNSLLEVQ